MEWVELSVHTAKEAEEAIANILNEFGANGVVIVDPADLMREKRDVFGEKYELDKEKYPKDGIILKAYFGFDAKWPDKKAAICEEIELLRNYNIDIGRNDLTASIVKEEDWENKWKKHFKPMRVTDRFTIVPSWEKYKKQAENELIIEIDPGMAFGTGTHPTTILSLQALEETVKQNDIVLDVGVGSGILSIAAVLLGAKHVYGYDLDQVAVKSTHLNRDRNRMEDRITASENDLLKGVSKQADIIVSNILADILVMLVEDAWDNLADGGYFITSGIIKQKEQIVKDELEKAGFEIIRTSELDHWISIVAKK